MTQRRRRLTEIELDVLEAVAQGLENAQIARHQFRSVETIRTHMQKILAKLKARNRTHAVAIAYHLGAPPVLTFWLAYILTRPLGASLGDLLSQSRTYGGAGLGTIYTSIAFLTVIIALVAWVSFEDDRARKADAAR